MVPVATPPFDENAAFAVKRASAEQLVKSVRTKALADPPAAIDGATGAGNGLSIRGVHDGPAVCTSEKPENITLAAGTCPEFEIVRIQARAFGVPILLVIKAERTGDAAALSTVTGRTFEDELRPELSTAVPLVEKDPSFEKTWSEVHEATRDPVSAHA